MIRYAIPNDAIAIANIYNYYIEKSVATFEEKVIDEANIQERVNKVIDQRLPWLVAVENGEIVGYAYATKWNERSAYRHSCEITVYVSHVHQSNGWGLKLYEELFSELKAKPMHCVIAGITLPNQASVALHEKFGMKKVAHFIQVGNKFDQWLDVGYWQIMLDV